MKLNEAAARVGTPQPDWSLAQWLAWQERLHPNRIDLGLERVRRVALRLGLLPARAATLTITGTNGKGSSAVLAAAIYRAAGYRTACYTSPHLLRYNERVTIDGVPAADAELCTAFAAVEAVRGDVSLTYFEFGTLAALWLFRRARVEVQVLEVGLGGRLDAVNIVDADASIVTEIGLDHMEWLGPDRESIGREKAGIYRALRPAICVDPDPPRSLLAGARHSDLLRIGVDFTWQRAGQGWTWQGRRNRLTDLPPPALPGEIQFRNGAGVLAAVEILQGLRPVSRAAMEAGLIGVRLPGRLERHGDLLLDVAHNAEAITVLVDYVRAQSWRPRALVIGMMRDKPVEAVAALLHPLFDTVYAAGLPRPRGLSGVELAARLATAGMRPCVALDVPVALAAARAGRGSGRIVVCGSFKTVAAALSC
ncbi:MAG TPA: bifunctional tetrahydrofolate synthase/dihydrofolate synthase [Nevskiaceae bacterium]|nr:bifunctional tetrahydrofolate synthase/dihydrofolate synthase [Nevskiaceae bacterium]